MNRTVVGNRPNQAPAPTGASPAASNAAPQAAAAGDPPAAEVGVGDDEGGERDLVGEVLLDRYKIVKRLGAGGMGTVYLGEHTTIQKKFAIKVLSHQYAYKKDLVQRFLQEARAASMISQQNVVEITDFGDTPDGSVFFVMEFLDGEDLADTIDREGALRWPRVKAIILQICSALQAAHDAGIIHRDMKPENCFRIKRGGSDDFIKVLDFGIAKVTNDDGEGKGLTQTGMIFGTPEYMSPEQAKGARADYRADIYATGVIMYELLCGDVPFSADTFMGVLTKHMFDIPDAPSSRAAHMQIPQEVEAIVLKALQKDREFRFQSMDEMAEALNAVGTGAASVAVVQESISRPVEGRIDFSGSMGIETAEYEPPADDRKKVVAVVGGLALVGALVGGAFAWSGGDRGGQAQAQAELPPTKADVEPMQEVPEPVVDTPVVDAPTEPIAARGERVVFKITTNVEAKILDAADGAIYGTSNSNSGVDVEKSKDALRLILRAEGYEDLEVKIIPNRDKKFEKVLKKIRGRRGGGGKKTGGGKPEAGAEPDTNPPKVDKKPDSSPVHHGDLKNPFARKDR